jgi:hypothetical protein
VEDEEERRRRRRRNRVPRARLSACARTRIVGPWTFHYPYRGLAGPDRRSPSSIPPFPPPCGGP